MEITERRSTETYSCDGKCDAMPQLLVPIPRSTARNATTFYIEPSRYRANFWIRYPDAVSGCRIEVVGRRVRADGTVGQRTEVRTWDLDTMYDPSIPDWLRLIVDVDLYKLLPLWAQRLWTNNAHTIVPAEARS